MSAGKGDKPRPTNLIVYRENYDAIFSKKRHTPSDTPTPNDQSLVYNDAPEAHKDSIDNDLR
jgi:hypothetical protein